MYAYDLGGNLTSVKEYAYTTGTLPASPVKTETGTYSTAWKDQLLNWNGTAMTYDAIGNMLTKGNTSYTWTLGRKLSTVNNGKKIQYYYDHTGARVKKYVDGVVTEYRMAGDLIASEVTGSRTVWYQYDSAGNVQLLDISGVNYYYIRNLQNDIIAIVDANGKAVVKYTYDSWGKVLSITGDLKDTVGQINPFRYRGYYYDSETGMYYLKNRYYDPELRRFICPDEIMSVNESTETLHNRNLYIYCNQNPVVRMDYSGEIWYTSLIVGAAVGALYSVTTQLIFDGEVNGWDVLNGAVSGALATTSVGKIGQTIGNCVLTIATDMASGNDLKTSVINGAIAGAWAFVGGEGEGFDKTWRRYNFETNYLNKVKVDNWSAFKDANKSSRIEYVNKQWEHIENTAIGYVKDFSKEATKTVVQKFYRKQRIIGYARHYDGRTKRSYTYTIYGY